jgi:penicillin-binding protein 1C
LQRAIRTAQTQVADAAAAWVVADILADPLARSVTFGLDNPLASRHHAPVKTGTSKDMRDNWCVGFTDRYTVGVWVGNFDGSAMRDVSGVTGAAPVWLELVNFLHRHAASRPLPAPGSLVTARVDFEQDIEPAREEYFLAGTESTFIAHKPVAASRVSIAYPGNGTLIALDPDMPADVQRVRFVAAPAAPGYEWSLDGEDFSEAGNAVFWPPQPGRHVLALKDIEGVEVDRVRFEVRGAPAR